MSISVARATTVGRSQQRSVRRSRASASCGNTPIVPSRMLCLSCTLPAGETQDTLSTSTKTLLTCNEEWRQEGQVDHELEKDHARDFFGHSTAGSFVVVDSLLLNFVLVKFPVFETVREHVRYHQMLQLARPFGSLEVRAEPHFDEEDKEALEDEKPDKDHRSVAKSEYGVGCVGNRDWQMWVCVVRPVDSRDGGSIPEGTGRVQVGHHARAQGLALCYPMGKAVSES